MNMKARKPLPKAQNTVDLKEAETKASSGDLVPGHIPLGSGLKSKDKPNLLISSGYLKKLSTQVVGN